MYRNIMLVSALLIIFNCCNPNKNSEKEFLTRNNGIEILKEQLGKYKLEYKEEKVYVSLKSMNWNSFINKCPSNLEIDSDMKTGIFVCNLYFKQMKETLKDKKFWYVDFDFYKRNRGQVGGRALHVFIEVSTKKEWLMYHEGR